MNNKKIKIRLQENGKLLISPYTEEDRLAAQKKKRAEQNKRYYEKKKRAKVLESILKTEPVETVVNCQSE